MGYVCSALADFVAASPGDRPVRSTPATHLEVLIDVRERGRVRVKR